MKKMSQAVFDLFISLFLLSFCENERCTCVYVNSEIIMIIVIMNFLNNRNLLIIKYVN